MIPPIDRSMALVVITRPRLEEVARETASDHHIRYDDLVSMRRTKVITRARQDFFWRARMIRRADGSVRYSTTAIGRFFKGKGGRTQPMDHSTVVWGTQRHIERMRIALLDTVRRDLAKEVRRIAA